MELLPSKGEKVASHANKIGSKYFLPSIDGVTFLLSQLGVDPSDPSVRHSAVMKKVAAWARNNNRNDQSDPSQFDIAVLIRR